MGTKVVFITKSLCYHQVYLSDVLYSIYKNDFCFIQTREPLDFRVAAHQEGFERPYLKGLSRSNSEFKDCISILKHADVIIVGEVSFAISKYFNKKAILLRYSERIFKSELHNYNFFQKIKQVLYYCRLRSTINRKSYLLSAGAYTPLDYARFGLFKNKSFVWGYFPQYFDYDWQQLLDLKNNNECVEIAWVSRLIYTKHPESALAVAKVLLSKGLNFRLHIIGDGDANAGELKESLFSSIKENKLEKKVIMHGKLPAEEVLQFYKKCDIALFTASFSEGWGVGVNEAMNAGCAVVCAHSVGSALYIIENNKNGIVYQYKDDNSLCEHVYNLTVNKELRRNIGYNAYKTIQDTWNYNEAGKRLSSLIDSIISKKEPTYKNGPCSKAQIIKEKWGL